MQINPMCEEFRGGYKVVDIPKSAFTWDEGGKNFTCTTIANCVSQFDTLIGFIGYWVGGSATIGFDYRTSSLAVTGWIPSLSQPISSGWTFVCKAIGIKN